MPRKPMHPCSIPGCPNLTYSRYCELHTKEENKRYETYDRDKATKKLYSGSWKKIRESYFKRHPFCEYCYSKGILVKAEHVHHKVPLKEGGSNDEENLVSLCKSCHSKEHAKRDDRWHRKKVYSY